uniref:Uncharacterized protein n=1 Tax=Avena sativa TaxID=4498 RepID=A0ACD5YPB6_AVESA
MKKVEAITPALLRLPRAVLANNILVRLPGSDLRRVRRVCKEWRDIISDPIFIQEHMVNKPKLLPAAHTIVFFPGFTYGGSREDTRNGHGFLFDEHWRLKAELAVGRWDDLIGACNGLLCFLESCQGSIKIIEPFTGESLAVPQPPDRSSWPTGQLRRARNPCAYCFGFDATARRYKIVYHGYPKETVEELHVYTLGGGKGAWTRVDVARSVHGEASGEPSYVDGAVYWPSRTYKKNSRRDEKLVRFDLATEKITSEQATPRHRLNAPTPEWAVFCRLVDATPCVMTYSSYGEWDAWFREAQDGGTVCFPGGRVLLRVFTDDGDPGLYLRRIERSHEFGQRMLLFEVGTEQPPSYEYNGRASFVPARRHQQLPVAGAPPSTQQCYARTFGYDPTVSAAPLALYLGTSSP